MLTKAPASRARSASRGPFSSGSAGGKSSGSPVATMCQYSPTVGPHGMDLGADQCGEFIGAQLARVRDRPIEAAKEMIGQLEEIVARAFVGLDDLRRV